MINNHEITKQEQRDEVVLAELVRVWEASVRATHDFLREEDVEKLKPLVFEGLGGIEKLYCIWNDKQQPVAFMGIEGNKLEMLFIHPQSRGRGVGRQLIEYAIQVEGIRYVDVNEQNPRALGFYEHLGFHCFERSELDEQGNPFPILHLKL